MEQALENWNKENDHVQSLLYPIIYQNYPSQEQIRTKGVKNFTETLKTHIPEYPEILSIKVLDDLNAQFEMDIQTSEHEAFLFDLIHLHNTAEGREEQPSQIAQTVREFFLNPYQSFFDVLDEQVENQSFNKESQEFEKIVREVCRDNVITEAEKAFLIEKGREHFIDEDRINQLLQDPFMGKSTFKIFISQICEDGVITPTERAYITEKSAQYNVSSQMLDEMINIGLARAKMNAETAESKPMFTLVVLYLIANAFHLEKTISNLRWLLGQSEENANNEGAH